MSDTEFAIDEGLRDFLPEANELERELLEESIVSLGRAKEPIVVWDEENLLVDGHRRYAICLRRKLPFEVERRSFVDRQAVEAWMLENQLARRNLLDHDRSMLASRLLKVYRTADTGDAAGKVAEATGQSRRSVYRQSAYAKSFENLIPQWQDSIKSRTVGKVAKYVTPLAGLSDREQKRLFDATVKDGDTSALQAKFPGKEEAAKDAPKNEPLPLETQVQPTDQPPVQPVEDPADKPEEPLPEPPRLVTTDPSVLIENAERAGGAFGRSVDQVFGDHGIGSGIKANHWKRRIDEGLRKISSTLQEIRESYSKDGEA